MPVDVPAAAKLPNPRGERYRVLLLAFACEPGAGSEPGIGWNWAYQIAKYHDVTVLTDRDHQQRIEAEFARIGPVEGLQIEYFGPGAYQWPLFKAVGHTGYCLWWMRKVGPFIDELQRKRNFDIMHHITYGACRYPTALWGHGVPVIWGPVGGMEDTPWPFVPMRHLRSAFEEIVRNLSNEFLKLPFGLLRRGARQSALVVSSTKETKAAFEAIGVESVLMPAIGIEEEAAVIRPRTTPDGPLRLLFAGRIVAWKGVDLAIRAIAVAGTGVRLTVIGGGPFLEPAKQLARDLEVLDRVDFRGGLSREETLKAFAEHHALLFPSLHDSGGFVVLEAMANRLPVICLDRGGPAEAVEDGCGIRVKAASPDEAVTNLKDAIARYDSRRDLLEQEGENARTALLRKYEWNRKGRAMTALYERVFANR